MKFGKITPILRIFDERKAKAAIARFVSLHPTNLAQKSEIIVEHFRAKVRPKIGGKAKAMVVTPSRLHAVRYKQAFDKYIAECGYTDVKAQLPALELLFFVALICAAMFFVGARRGGLDAHEPDGDGRRHELRKVARIVEEREDLVDRRRDPAAGTDDRHR